MSYEKTTWKKGDEITAEKLNKLEEGVEAANNKALLPLMAEKNVDGFYPDAGGFPSDVTVYVRAEPSPSFSVTAGEKYVVYWDDKRYDVTAYDSSNFINDTVFLGNGDLANLPGKNEPFAIALGSFGAFFYAFDDDSESHRIGVYQEVDALHLPASTVSDEGKFLRVVGGKAAWVALTDVSQEGV